MLRILAKYKDNDGWYFTDYLDTVYEKGHIFETGEELLEIKDQFFYNHPRTEIGWKFICRIKNVNDNKLPTLNRWDYVKNPIELK